jgi:hypothetical protein
LVQLVFPHNETRNAGAIAAVNGIVVGAVSAKTVVTVTVHDAPEAPYTVTAHITAVYPANLTWKALLKPHADYGGNVSLTASCTQCNFPNETSVHNLRWGDIWVCSGVSKLPM